VVGHTDLQRTLSFHLQFYTTPKEENPLEMATEMFYRRETYLLCKPNTQKGRGLIASLSIPKVANSFMYIYFISMDTFNDFDYVLTIFCVQTRFCQFISCQTTITPEKGFKLIVKNFIPVNGKPTPISSDNYVRFTEDQCFYCNAFDAM